MNRKTLVLILAALVVVGAGLGIYGFREYYRPHEAMQDIPAAFHREAIQLVNEFATNETTANQQYLSKVVSVSGMVKAIDSTEGKFILILGDTASMNSVRCFLDSINRPKSGVVKAGTIVAVKGYCTGFNPDELLGSDVILDRCALDLQKH